MDCTHHTIVSMVRTAIQKKLTSAEVRSITYAFRRRLAKEGIPITRLILFGSYANGNADKDSDIDIAVIVPSHIVRGRQRKISTIPWIAKQTFVKLEPHVMSTKELGNRWLSLPHMIKQANMNVKFERE